MKWVALAALLLSGCTASALGRQTATHDAAPSVSIVAENLCTDRPLKIVTLRAEATGLTPPLRFHWSLGNGKEWDGPEVPEQEYEVGRYDVILTVSDAARHVQKASVAIESESHGCGGK